VSQFTPSYGMVLNLLQRYELAKAKQTGGTQLRPLPGHPRSGSTTKPASWNCASNFDTLSGPVSDVPWEAFEVL